MSVGKGTKAGKALNGFITEIERVRERKKQIGEEEKGIFAKLKADGFDAATIRTILKLRLTDKDKRQKAEDLLATYLHAIGMDEDKPLFSAIGLMGVDTAVREQVVEALTQVVPTVGDIIVRAPGGTQVRLFRDAEGLVHAEDVVEAIKVKPDRPDDEAPPTTTFPASGRARTVSRDYARTVADRAEATSREKLLREAAALDAASGKPASD